VLDSAEKQNPALAGGGCNSGSVHPEQRHLPIKREKAQAEKYIFRNDKALSFATPPMPAGATVKGTQNMQALLAFSPSLPKTYASHAVWSGSMRVDNYEEVKATGRQIPPAIMRKRLLKIYRAARQWRAEKPKTMTQGALRVLESLCTDFPNIHTGRLFPTIATIARKCGLGTTCVKRALNALTALGIITKLRRCLRVPQIGGGFLLRQLSNLYTILPPECWRAGYNDKEAPGAAMDYGERAKTYPYGFDVDIKEHATTSAAAASMAEDIDPLAAQFGKLFLAVADREKH